MGLLVSWSLCRCAAVVCFNMPNRVQAWTLKSELRSLKKLWNCQFFDDFLDKNLHPSNLPGCDLLSQCRLARGREEWESAALQNANTKCNGLLPVWGPHVPESAFATCLARCVEKLLLKLVCIWVGESVHYHRGTLVSTMESKVMAAKP